MSKTKFATEPIVSGKVKRLPQGHVASFRFPSTIDPSRVTPFDNRKIVVINQRDFKRIYSGFRKEDLFIGSLKLL